MAEIKTVFAGGLEDETHIYLAAIRVRGHYNGLVMSAEIVLLHCPVFLQNLAPLLCSPLAPLACCI